MNNAELIVYLLQGDLFGWNVIVNKDELSTKLTTNELTFEKLDRISQHTKRIFCIKNGKRIVFANNQRYD